MSGLGLGIDVSGLPGIGNYMYMGLIIATDEFINKTMQDIDYYEKKDRRLDKQRLKEYIRINLDFNSKDCRAFCAEIHKDSTIGNIRNMLRIKKRNYSNDKITRNYDNLLFQKVRDPIVDFLAEHEHSLDNVAFQCDTDCRGFLKHNSLKGTDGGYAYSLADIIAYANNIGEEPKGVKRLSLHEELEKELIQIL